MDADELLRLRNLLQKRAIKLQLDDAYKRKLWYLVESLARQALELDPCWFEAAVLLQAACIEIAAHHAEHELWAAVEMKYVKPETALENVRGSVLAARDANRLVRQLADVQAM